MKKFIWVIVSWLILLTTAQAANIVQIAMDEKNVPFFLDNNGHVWALNNIGDYLHLVKLPNLEHIKMIAPYIAVDSNGSVFTWSIDDLKIDTDQGNLVVLGYTTPKKFGNISRVTSVAYSARHFVTVVDSSEILDWIEIPSGIRDNYGTKSYGPVRRISTQGGIKAIAAATKGETVPTGRLAFNKYSYGLVALFDDGTVMGWGITPTGQVSNDGISTDAVTPSVLLAKFPDATGLAMNERRTIILQSNGKPLFWGECEVVEKDQNDNLIPKSGVHSVEGSMTDVIGITISRNDDMFPDMFIKHDGTLWSERAPVPTSFSYQAACSKIPSNQYFLKHEQVPFYDVHPSVLQVVTNESFTIALDENHELWVQETNCSCDRKFHKVKTNLLK
jgi:alpha-tubulin suppressor-like RCC1 family protein